MMREKPATEEDSDGSSDVESETPLMPARKAEAISSIKNKDVRRREYAKVKKAKTKVI